MRSHASVPVARSIGNNIFRIYFSARDSEQRSQLACVDIDIREPLKVLHVSERPLLGPGRLGTFDDSGVMLSWIIDRPDGPWFYYIGWNLGVTVPFRNSVGIATEDRNGNLVRMSEGPVLDRTFKEPHFVASCCILPADDGWAMWYLSCLSWEFVDGRPRHRYHIKYATSDNAIDWRRDGRVCIDFKDTSEYAISRPSVIRDPDCFRMWYSFRGASYRIGYAESGDGVSWTRKDELAGISCSLDGWDSEMIEYPYVFDHLGVRYLLYNGNGYGRSGVGIAVWE